MSTAFPRRRRPALVALALVLGLFALHGLTHHGEQVPSVTTAAAGHGHGAAAPAQAPAEGPGGGSHHDGPGAVLLCATMILGAAVLWLLRATGRRGVRPLALLRRPPPRAVRLPVGARAHAPPDRWALSVCRC